MQTFITGIAFKLRGLSRRLCAGALLFVLAACAQPPEIIGIDNPTTPVGSVETATQHRVFIATTREDTEVVGALFSELRADELGLASVDVSVPPNHVVGALERPKRLPPNPATEFAIVEPTVYAGSEEFVASLNSELRKRPAGDKDILFFVHGYNTTTSEALMRVGQFVEDSGFKGVPVLFTWASAGKTSRYVYDLNSALIARTQLIEAASIVSQSAATEYHMFAHSMGGFLTMEAIVYAAQTQRFNQTGRLRDIILASPDIDLDLFRMQLAQIDDSFDRLYVLLSNDDYALRASRLLAGGVPRVGAADAEELVELGVNVIDLSQITDTRSDSHSKFAGSPEVVQLIGLGLNSIPTYGDSRRTVLDQFIGEIPITIVGGG
ncbi:MAG: alpha/beta fold hydrolase [Dinoroseobacter sp.]|nr:alpha/beta fold hydrolase [Dinoroseobacter sp.]